MSVRFWRSAGRFAASIVYASHVRYVYTVPSLYRPSTDGLILILWMKSPVMFPALQWVMWSGDVCIGSINSESQKTRTSVR